MRYTPEDISKLEPYQIIVFGSNTEGRHGKGLAQKCLKKFGAIYGQSKGLQGQSYAIITKNLRKGTRSVSLNFILEQLKELVAFALEHSDKEFLLTKIGTNHAGYTESEIEGLFRKLEFPKNIILPKFENHLDKWFDILV
jgi:hypothetical protein